MRRFFSAKDVFKTKNIAVMAMMAALHFVLSQFTIYLSPTFKAITFSYLPGAIVAILYGPWAALAFGFVADTIGFIAKPVGPYFIGYAVSEMLANFTYAAFLYRKPVSLVRVLLSRLVITAVVTFGLNYLWNAIMYGSAASAYFTSVRLINNLAQLPVYVALIMFFGRLALRLDRTEFFRAKSS
ncbi:MAG: folate family ECF transporter S component [Clostridiales bacterium]|nr:folate family ECF transporter S component [Clostridiales bacterium]